MVTPSIDSGSDATHREATRKAMRYLIPLMCAIYFMSYLDRTNVALAKVQLARDLGITAAIYGLGAGIFFIGYALLEVPSNLILARVGARRWIARIMISWGLVAAAMALVRTPAQFYSLRLLLGVTEAGFFPGIIYYLTQWFPARERARAMALFMTAIPVSAALGNPLSGWLLGLDGWMGRAGWQWLFVIEGLPSVLLGIAVFRLLPDRPADAPWLTPAQRAWLTTRLERDGDAAAAPHGLPPLRALAHPVLWLASLLYFLAMLSSNSYTFWAPTVVREALGAGNLEVGLITGAISAVAALTMLAVGTHSDRTGERGRHAAACIAVAALGWVGAGLLQHPIARVFALALVPVGIYGFQPAFWCLPSTLLRGSAAAAGIALVNAVGSTGGFVGPYAVGLLKEATGGTSGAFLALAALASVAAMLCLVLGRWAATQKPKRQITA